MRSPILLAALAASALALPSAGATTRYLGPDSPEPPVVNPSVQPSQQTVVRVRQLFLQGRHHQVMRLRQRARRVAPFRLGRILPPREALMTSSWGYRYESRRFSNHTLRLQRIIRRYRACTDGSHYVSTAYGPPWGGIEGTGITSTGHPLRGRMYIVAVDPSVIPYHSRLRIWPNPFRYRGYFQAEDTGGAIVGNRIDFYDWKGRAHQNRWGVRGVRVCRGS